jgi:hypothetical protein
MKSDNHVTTLLHDAQDWSITLRKQVFPRFCRPGHISKKIRKKEKDQSDTIFFCMYPKGIGYRPLKGRS